MQDTDRIDTRTPPPVAAGDQPRNRFGQLSALHEMRGMSQEVNLGESMLIEYLRSLIRTESDPDANVDFDSWAWLRSEVGGRLGGEYPSDFDRERKRHRVPRRGSRLALDSHGARERRGETRRTRQRIYRRERRHHRC
ncbi:MAG: hypothetical protein H8F28_24540 [Fibrella sp.]|nr:hypothetical protein [Armatimonadota bacterium]